MFKTGHSFHYLCTYTFISITVGGILFLPLWYIKCFSMNVRVFLDFEAYSRLKMKCIAIRTTRAMVTSSTSQTFSTSTIISKRDCIQGTSIYIQHRVGCTWFLNKERIMLYIQYDSMYVFSITVLTDT